MIKTVIEKLKSYQEISDYRILYSDSTSNEVYYILDRVETLRNTHTKSSLNVTIYCDYEDLRGQASFVVFDSYSEEEIDEKIKDAIYQTSFSKNTYFSLPKGETKVFGEKQHFTESDSVFKIAEAVLDGSKFKDGWISCNEVFIRQNTVRIINSRGVDYTYYTNSVNIEVIPTFKNEGGEIELYTNLDYEKIDLRKITTDTYNFLKNADLRNKAVKYEGPNELPVLLDEDETYQILDNLVSNLNYSTVYNKMNILNVGDEFYGKDPIEAPDIKLVPVLEGSNVSRPVDANGVLLKEVDVVKDNIVKTFHGDYVYGQYLGVEEPTGQINNLYVADGKNSLEELTNKPYLHAIAFSSFQFDLFSGNFGGEVRLAIYFDGKECKPVTGLTIGGNIHELKNSLKFSNERVVRRGYSGPKNMLVSKMSIN